jgi:hypothetical protein
MGKNLFPNLQAYPIEINNLVRPALALIGTAADSSQSTEWQQHRKAKSSQPFAGDSLGWGLRVKTDYYLQL